MTKEEYKVLAATGTGVSHCPAPAVPAASILNIKEMQEAGILVSLGCDGSATNDSSNLLDALRMAYLMQAYHTKERGGCVSAYDMLKVATVNGAKTLGRTDLGTLEAGKAADLFMIDTETLELAGALHDPKNLLARVGLTGPVWMTMINGNIVYKDGILKGGRESWPWRERLYAQGSSGNLTARTGILFSGEFKGGGKERKGWQVKEYFSIGELLAELFGLNIQTLYYYGQRRHLFPQGAQ